MSERVSNIGNICDSVLNQMRDYGMGPQDKAWLENIAISYYSDRLKGFHMPSVVAVRFPVTLKSRVWTYPPDYMRYTKIAYQCSGSNRIDILGLNEDMNISSPIATCQQPIEQAPSFSDGFFLANGFNDGTGWSTPLFAVGGGYSVNYYRRDDENQCIRFLDNLRVGTSFIEYLSAGKGVSAATIVPLTYRAHMESWLIVRMCQLKPKVRAQAPMAAFEDDAMRTKWDANLLDKGLTAKELQDETYKSCGFNLR